MLPVCILAWFSPCSPGCLDFLSYACFRLVLLHRYLLRALPIILFSNLFATVSRFACSGFPFASVEITFIHVPICVSSFSSSRSCSLALALA